MDKRGKFVRVNSLIKRLQIRYLLENTDLQKQLIAQMVGVNNSVVSHEAAGAFKERRGYKITEKHWEMLNEYAGTMYQILREMEIID